MFKKVILLGGLCLFALTGCNPTYTYFNKPRIFTTVNANQNRARGLELAKLAAAQRCGQCCSGVKIIYLSQVKNNRTELSVDCSNSKYKFANKKPSDYLTIMKYRCRRPTPRPCVKKPVMSKHAAISKHMVKSQRYAKTTPKSSTRQTRQHYAKATHQSTVKVTSTIKHSSIHMA